MIRNILLVALGGAVGSVCRYLLSDMNAASWPWGTSVVIGILAVWAGMKLAGG